MMPSPRSVGCIECSVESNFQLANAGNWEVALPSAYTKHSVAGLRWVECPSLTELTPRRNDVLSVSACAPVPIKSLYEEFFQVE